MYASMPEALTPDSALLAEMETAKEIIAGVRAVRAHKNIPAKESLRLRVVDASLPCGKLGCTVAKLSGLEAIEEKAEKDPTAQSFMVGTCEFNVPMAAGTDVEAEKARIEKDIKYYEGFKASVEKKLSNERFVNNAPEAVVAGERKKLDDANTKLAALRATLAAL